MLVYFVLVVLVVTPTAALACTIFTAADEDTVLAGNNEDWKSENTRIWFTPAKDGKYGGVFFGFRNGYPQGGMNEKGLFYDWAALSLRSDIVYSPDNKNYLHELDFKQISRLSPTVYR